MLEKNNSNWRQWFFLLGIIGAIQFVVLTILAMYFYDGGTLHQRELRGYSFLLNYFSDLGRTIDFRGQPNDLPRNLFRFALSMSGGCLVLFFFALPGIFNNKIAKGLAIITGLFGLVAAVAYIAIANIPWNVDYRGHVYYVRIGFLAFLMVTIFYSIAILLEPHYPRRYAVAFLVFAIILGTQIVIMFFGPRAYRSEEALFLQVVAQKIVVYSQILCLLYQSIGALKLSRNAPMD